MSKYRSSPYQLNVERALELGAQKKQRFWGIHGIRVSFVDASAMTRLLLASMLHALPQSATFPNVLDYGVRAIPLAPFDAASHKRTWLKGFIRKQLPC